MDEKTTGFSSFCVIGIKYGDGGSTREATAFLLYCRGDLQVIAADQLCDDHGLRMLSVRRISDAAMSVAADETRPMAPRHG